MDTVFTGLLGVFEGQQRPYDVVFSRWRDVYTFGGSAVHGSKYGKLQLTMHKLDGQDFASHSTIFYCRSTEQHLSRYFCFDFN